MKKYKHYIELIFGCLFVAISFVIFLEPNSFVTGGVSGLSLIISNFYKIDISLFVFIVSLLLLLISYIFLGKSKTFNSILGSIIFPIFIKIISIISLNFNFTIENLLLSTIFAGILNGLGLGLVYKAGYNTGGTDIICELFKKYLKVTTGTGIFLTEFLIVLGGGLVFGINNLLYALLVLIISSKISDRVVLGISSNKSFYIITNKEKEVTNYILKDLKHGVTILEGKGSYTNNPRSVLMTVIPTNEYTILKEGIKNIDNNAFFIVCDAYEVSGGE